MGALLTVSAILDRILAFCGRLGAWAGVLLIVVVCVDVVTRYTGVSRPFDWNGTKFQEAEYWLHTVFFSMMIGWAYTRQTHVRIDLVRERLPLRLRFVIEMVGAAMLLLPFAVLGTWYTSKYAYASFLQDESSKSGIGLTNVWILKFVLVAMFVLLMLAAVSQFIKSLAGFLGKLPPSRVHEALGASV